MNLTLTRDEAVEIATRCMADRAGDLEAYDQGRDFALDWREDAEAVVDALIAAQKAASS